MFLWIDGKTKSILEEVLFLETFKNFTTEEPKLLWLQGTHQPSDGSVVKVCDLTDIDSLNNRNENAIKNAMSPVFSPASDVSVLTTTDGEQTVAKMIDDFADNSIFGEAVNNATMDDDGDEHLTCHTEKTPSSALVDEQKLIVYLAALNDVRSGVLFRMVSIGGQIVRLQTFHYPALNTEAPRNKKQRTYIDAEDLPILFAYEFKSALTVRVQQQTKTKKYVGRAFLSYCQLEFCPDSADDHRYDKHQMILVGILTTLCVTARNDFLVYDTKLNAIQLWKNGMQLMRNFYCNRSIPVDKSLLMEKRNEFFGCYRWYYDPKRGIARNHQNPGNYSEDFRKSDHLEETAKWKVGVGQSKPFVEEKNSKAVESLLEAPGKTRSQIAKDTRAANLKAKNEAGAVDLMKKINLRKPPTSHVVVPSKKSQAVVPNAAPKVLSSYPIPTTARNQLRGAAATLGVAEKISSGLADCEQQPLHFSTSSFAQVRLKIAMEADVVEAQLLENKRIKIAEVKAFEEVEEAKEFMRLKLLRQQAATRMEEEGA